MDYSFGLYMSEQTQWPPELPSNLNAKYFALSDYHWTFDFIYHVKNLG